MQNSATIEIILWLVFTLPLLSCMVCILIPERYSWLASICASLFILVCTVLSFILFFNKQFIIIRVDWFTIGQTKVLFTLFYHDLAWLMTMIVTVISFLVHLYSTGYMAGDSGTKRYFAMLGFFTFSMLGIVLSQDLLVTFMFWELMGFSSYMLIGHWNEKPTAASAAKKAFLYNRVSDVAMLIGILIFWTHQQTVWDGWATVASLCVFFGVVGKSAQLPLSFWLPDAMEGPTPVSALLHAATMVAAGVFLLIRFNGLMTEPALLVITITGGVTAVFGAVCALNQFDIKKILAYSTISQLGLMITAIGIGSKEAALLHLFTHAFFKAGLFLAAGSIIHALSHSQFHAEKTVDVQDIRNLGGLRKKMPITFLTFCITGASLAGTPFLSGFISKDAILTAAFTLSNPVLKWTMVSLISLVSFCTVLYTYRIIRYVFLGPESKANAVESPWVMRAPMIVLALASCWFMISFNPFNTTGWLGTAFSLPQLSAIATSSSIAIALVAFATAMFIYRKETSLRNISVIQQGFGIDAFYQKTIAGLMLKISTVTHTTDKKWIDGALHTIAYTKVAVAHGTAWIDRNLIDGVVHVGVWFAKAIGSFTRSFQSGKIQLYIFWAVIGLIIFLFFALI